MFYKRIDQFLGMRKQIAYILCEILNERYMYENFLTSLNFAAIIGKNPPSHMDG